MNWARYVLEGVIEGAREVSTRFEAKKAMTHEKETNSLQQDIKGCMLFIEVISCKAITENIIIMAVYGALSVFEWSAIFINKQQAFANESDFFVNVVDFICRACLPSLQCNCNTTGEASDTVLPRLAKETTQPIIFKGYRKFRRQHN